VQLSIGAVDKKRDFSRNRVFYRGNILELPLEKSEEMHALIGSILAHVFTLESIASSSN